MSNTKLKLTVLRAPNGFRSIAEVNKYIEEKNIDRDKTVILYYEEFFNRTGFDINSIPVYMLRDSYWWMQQEAKRLLLLGISVILVGEYPTMKTLVGLGKTARSYHAKLYIHKLPFESDVTTGTVHNGYDTTSIRLSLVKFHKYIKDTDVIEASRAKDEQIRRGHNG